jgi:hypothetical protein
MRIGQGGPDASRPAVTDDTGLGDGRGRSGPARSRRARGQAGFVPLRILVAMVASTTVTAGVAGPMTYQALQADNQLGGRQPAEQPADRPGPTPSVLSGSADREEPADRRPTELAEGATTPSPGAATTTVPPEEATPGPDRDTPDVAATTVPTSPPPTQPPSPGPPGRPPTTLVAGPPTTGPPTTRPPITQPPTTSPPPATLPISSTGLVWAKVPRPDGADPLDGATVHGAFWVFFVGMGDETVEVVEFRLDDPFAIRPPHHVDRRPPFSLRAGPDDERPAPIEASQLDRGVHTVRADVSFTGGERSTRLATFVVR